MRFNRYNSALILQNASLPHRMSIISPKRLRNRKTVVPNNLNSESNLLQCKNNNRMEDTNSFTNDEEQIRSPSPLITT